MILEKKIRIVKALSHGVQPKVIANDFGVSPRTMEKYIEDIKRQYEATNSLHLACIFLRKKIIE